MRHTRNTVRMGQRGSRLGDQIDQFRELGRDTLGGVRSAAVQFLKSTHDVDLHPCIRDAILYGNVPKPIDVGEQAQVIGPDTSRNTRENQPYIWKSNQVQVAGGVQLMYRPTRPENLHRLLLSQDGAQALVITIGTAVPISLPITDGPVLPNRQVVKVPINVTTIIEFGDIGMLITPDNPLTLFAFNAALYRFAYQLSEAQLAVPC